MPEYTEELGLDSARMKRRIAFLNDQAAWHDERETPLDKACAATARRDAGIIALLLGLTHDASQMLEEAGLEFASIGLYSGMMLQSLVRPEHLRADFTDDGMVGRFSSAFFEDAKSDQVSEERELYFEHDSRQSPQQLLNLYQALRGWRGEDASRRFASKMAAHKLEVYAGATIGVSGLPIGRYLQLFDLFGANEISPREQETVFAAAIRRRDLIDAARNDEYHWRMMLKPAELVDLDLVALGVNALEAGDRSSSVILELAERVGTAAGLPFQIARDLHELPDEKPRPSYRYGG